MAGKLNHWLHVFQKSVTSQCGEDGIVAKALEVIGENDRWCVEFGAGNGCYLSNTFNLINHRGYAAVQIEPDDDRFAKLSERYARRDDVVTLHRPVGWTAEDGLDAVLRETQAPTNFDFLSIDVDGNDYHIWEAVREYRPKLVCIEFNPTMSNDVVYVQPRDPGVRHGSSLPALAKLARAKGYELIATTLINAIFVDRAWFPKFKIDDNSPHALRPDCPYVMNVFTTYDGQTLVSGNTGLPWHEGITYRPSQMQALPKHLQRFPLEYNWLQKRLYGLRRMIGRWLRDDSADSNPPPI